MYTVVAPPLFVIGALASVDEVSSYMYMDVDDSFEFCGYMLHIAVMSVFNVCC